MTKSLRLLTFSAVLMTAWFAVHGYAMKPQLPQASAPAPSMKGQTATLLPDGRWVLIGGTDNQGQVSSSIAVFDPNSQLTSTLGSSLRTARTGHTATLLPTGRVFIFGGLGADQRLVTLAEVFDPESGAVEFQNTAGLRSRAFHSATLLTDGRVLMCGGTGAGQKELNALEIWDPVTQKAKLLVPHLGTARQKHEARLMSDGRVMFWGGQGNGKDLLDGEVYDPAGETIASVRTAVSQNAAAAGVNFSSPANDDVNVPIGTVIKLRFSQPLGVATFNSRNVTLRGAEGVVEMKVVPAEQGMLAFATPSAPLAPASAYQFSFVGVFDNSGKELPATEFTFTTEGEQPSVEDWSPGLSDPGDWKTHREKSPWQDLPPLQAAAGVTAVSGQVLKLDGKPLPNVALSIDGAKTRSDGTGRFLLTGISSGHHVLLIDGRAASNRPRAYGVFEAGVDIAAGKTNVLTFVIWMTALDNAHAVTIPSPTTAPMVITSPLLPGLELHLPAGTKIADHEGRPVTRISITPIPVDRPPFPLPLGVHVPIYFTIQPGSAYIHTPYHKGAQLIYPNFMRLVPRTPVDFWNYDPDEKGWYVYGKGKVSANAQQVIPDAGVAIYEFTGAMIQGLPVPTGGGGFGNGGGGGGGGGGPTPPEGDPVDPSSGLFVYSKTDLFLPDVIPIDITRTYRQNDPTARVFGVGTNFPYEMFLTSFNNYLDAKLVFPDGSHIDYVCNNPVGCLNPTTEYTHTSSPTAFYGSRLVYTQSGFGWDLILKDGTVYRFGDLGPLQWIKDRYGNKLRICRAAANTDPCEAGYGDITKIISPNGRWVKFTYDTSHRITQITDNIGRIVSYTYNPAGDLWKVTDAKNGVTEYTYNTSHQMLTIKDPRGIVYLANDYDANGRVRLQTLVNSAQYQFSYTLDTNGKVMQTDATDPRGFVRRTVFDTNGYTTSDTFAVGTPEQASFTYNRDPATNRITSVTDSLSRTTAYTYYPSGKIQTITRLSGTASAATTSFTYEPKFQQLATVTDPLIHTFTFEYDGQGNLVKTRDPLQHETLSSYNGSGQPVTLTDPLGNTVSFEYDGADLIRVTDALGNVASRLYDAAGRVVSIVDPTGRGQRFEYDKLDRILSIADSLGGKTTLSYDPNGNLISVQDARQQGTNNKVIFAYNSMDRLESRTDQLLKQDTYEYDLSGNLTKVTDRRGKITTFQYDGLDRRVFAGFGTIAGTPDTYESTISYQYDDASRLTQVSDSIAGTITRQYDEINRQIIETSPQGSITSTFDAAGRRTGLQVAGQLPLSYGYDNANRLTTISQGASTITFGYDNANRRTTLALPNGVTVSYTYDAASQPTGLTYRLGSTVLGNLTYAYDRLGRQVQLGGSFARTNLPNALASATYDVANRLVNWGGTTLTYDFNGNLTNDGVNSFVWDTRNQLSAVGASTYQYDALGRRIRNDAGIDFLYAGMNPVQRSAGGTPIANMVGGSLDEIFITVESLGSFSPLRDALGSVIALADSSGTLVNQYTYDPYGSPSMTGSIANPFQFTGRENDGNGLYYYRARYYSPLFQRFISEDPLGVGGGDVNFYRYVANSPTNGTDSTGLYTGVDDAVFLAGGALVGLASQGVGDLLSGHLSGWEDYVGSAVGGALGGEALLYTGPVGAGAIGGATANAVTQGLKQLSGKQCGFDVASLVGDTVAGAALGKFGQLVSKGVTLGRGNYNFLYRKMVTQLRNGTISSVSVQTAAKMFVGRAADTGLVPGALVGAAVGGVADAAGFPEPVTVGRQCGCQ